MRNIKEYLSVNTRFLISCFVFAFISVFFQKVYAVEKIVIVNLVNIFQKSPQQALAAKKLEIEFQDRATEIDLIQKDINAKIEILKINAKNMDTNARNALEEALTAQRENFSNKAKSFEHDQMQRQHEEQNKIVMQIKKIVQQIAFEKGYQLVIDSNAIIYFNNIQDITEDVLKKMDQK